MRKETRAVISIIIAIAMCLAIILPAFFAMHALADNLQDDLEKNNKEKEEYEQKIEETKKEREDKQAEKAAIDDEIGDLASRIDDLAKSIENNEADMAAKEEEIAAIEAEIDENDALIKLRLRTMYEQGTSSYLDVLFSADSVSDLIVRADMVQQILEYDQNLIDTLATQKASIEAAKVALAEVKKANEEAKAKLAGEKAVLDEKSAESQALIDELRKDEEYLQEEYELRVAENQRILEEIAEERRKLEEQRKAQNQTPAYTGGQLGWPSTQAGYISSEFGTRTFRGRPDNHTGIDIALPMGTPVLAAEDGVVLSSGWSNGGYGYCVTIDHGSITTLYAHNSVLQVSAGQTVSKGDQIALVGSTGNSTGPHIHFGVIDNATGQYVNPRPYIF